MKKIFYILLLLPFFSYSQVGDIYKRLSRVDTIYVLGTGQSNMNGRNFGDYDGASNTKVQAWNGSAWVTATRGVAPMGWKTPGVLISASEGGDAKYDTATGSWFYLAKMLQERTGKVVRVISVPYGGSAIDTWVASGESSTAFATMKTYMSDIGSKHVDIFLWDQGETDSGLSDTAYKRRFDSLTAQLDRQTWFGKDVPMFITSVPDSNHLQDFRKINNTLRSLGLGQYDKRWTWVDTRLEPTLAETFSSADGYHYSAFGQYNIAAKIMQLLFNRPSVNNTFPFTSSTERTNIAAFAPRTNLGLLTEDETTKVLYYFNGTSFLSLTPQLSISGSDAYYSAGKFGVGGAPTYNMDVTGDQRITGVLGINSVPQSTQRLAIVSGGTTSGSYAIVASNSTPANLFTVRSDKLTNVLGNLNVDGSAGNPTNRAFSITAGGNTYSFVVEKTSGFAILITAAGDITFGSGTMTWGAGAITSANFATALSNETGTGVVVFGTAPTFTTNITSPLVIGGTATTSALTFQTTTGIGTTNADMIFKGGNNGATEFMRILNSGNISIGSGTPAYKLDIISGSVNVLGTTGNTYRWNAADGTPSNTVTAVGWIRINVNGTDSWIPYYQ